LLAAPELTPSSNFAAIDTALVNPLAILDEYPRSFAEINNRDVKNNKK
jgi:hypothetical protein